MSGEAFKITREKFIKTKLEKLRKYLEENLPEEDYFLVMESLYRTYMEIIKC